MLCSIAKDVSSWEVIFENLQNGFERSMEKNLTNRGIKRAGCELNIKTLSCGSWNNYESMEKKSNWIKVSIINLYCNPGINNNEEEDKRCV